MNNEYMLSDLVWLLTKNVMALEKQKMACCGLTISQSHAIIEIGQVGERSLVDLAGALSLDKSTISRTVNSLVEAGYVERTTDLANRRYVTLSLTDSGKVLHASINEIFNSYCSTVMASIPESHKAQVNECIGLLFESFRKNSFID